MFKDTTQVKIDPIFFIYVSSLALRNRVFGLVQHGVLLFVKIDEKGRWYGLKTGFDFEKGTDNGPTWGDQCYPTQQGGKKRNAGWRKVTGPNQLTNTTIWVPKKKKERQYLSAFAFSRQGVIQHKPHTHTLFNQKIVFFLFWSLLVFISRVWVCLCREGLRPKRPLGYFLM